MSGRSGNDSSLRARISLRPITTDDEPFLLKVYAATRAQELSQVPWNEAQKQAFVRMQFDAQHRHYIDHYPTAQFQVILLDGKPAGRLYLAKIENEFRIIDVAVLPANRKTGIGSFVVGEILQDAQREELPVTMFIETYNPSLQLFERLGFQKKDIDPLTALMTWSPDSQASS